MKTLLTAIFAFIITFSTFSQSCCSIKQKCNNKLEKSITLNSQIHIEIKEIKLPNYTLDLNNNCRFALLQNSTDKRLVLYDRIKKEYWQNDPLRPYSTMENTLILGSVNYLLLLFDKKE